jgi:hypothetical protein
MYQRQLTKTEMADSMGFAGEERANKQFTTGELRDLFTYKPANATGCDTHTVIDAAKVWALCIVQGPFSVAPCRKP